MERARGIGPPSQAWEACVLPLNHARVARSPERSGGQCSETAAQRAPASLRAPWPSPTPISGRRIFSKVAAHEALSTDEAAEAMRQVMAGEATPAQLGGLLIGAADEGRHRRRARRLRDARCSGSRTPVEAPGEVVDTCGTGGDRSGTFNISTISAIVAAGAGVRVAKHGNRAASSHCGSADLLEALGVKIDLDAAGVVEVPRRRRDRVHVRAGVPPGDGARGSGPSRAPRPDRLQLPRAAHEPGAPDGAGRRRVRPGDAAADGGRARPAWDERDAVPRRRRSRRAHDDGTIHRVRRRRRAT